MKPIDYAKAFGIAAAVLILDVLIAIGVVYLWAVSTPGHSQDYYDTAGIDVARISTRIVGTALLFAAAWLFGRRNPNRNAYAFAIALAVFYAFLDAASVAFKDVFVASFAVTMALKLVGSLVGAWLATRGGAIQASSTQT